ncbi:TPA: hypothetical protein DEF17_08670 [bacterium]|nr:hypothetical protein [bacterium]
MRLLIFFLVIMILLGISAFMLFSDAVVSGIINPPLSTIDIATADSDMVYRSLAAFSPELVLLLTALLIIIFEFVTPRQRRNFSVLGFGGAAVAFFFAYKNFNTAPVLAFSGAVLADSWTGVARIAATAVAAVALIQIAPLNLFGFDDKESRYGEITILILLSALGITLMASSRDFLVTVIAFEIMSLSLYPVLAGNNSRKNYEATMKYFLMGALATALMLYGISFIFGETGLTRYAELKGFNARLLIGMVLFFSGLFIKAGFVPFHAWMPDVYETAPSFLGGFMAAGIKLGAFAAIGRLIYFCKLAPENLTTLVVALSAATLFLGNCGALFQTNLARLIGYSAIGHTGFIAMGIAASLETRSADGIASVIFYLISYAPAVIGFFAVIGMTEDLSKTRRGLLQSGGRNFEILRGLFQRKPVVAICLAVFLASMAGLPPAVGFWGKFYVFLTAYQAGKIGLLAVALINSLIAAWYYMKVMREAFSPLDTEIENRTSPVSLIIVIAMAVLVIYMGLLPDLFWASANLATKAM